LGFFLISLHGKFLMNCQLFTTHMSLYTYVSSHSLMRICVSRYLYSVCMRTHVCECVQMSVGCMCTCMYVRWRGSECDSFLEKVLVLCACMHVCMMGCTCARMMYGNMMACHHMMASHHTCPHVRGQERMPGMRRWKPRVH
jgi:hypothetical protein